MVKRPSTVTGLAVRFLIVIQYVQLVPFARSTETLHSICGAPERGVVGTTYQMMCLVAGQLNVNQRLVSLAARLPVNWVPVVMVVIRKGWMRIGTPSEGMLCLQ